MADHSLAANDATNPLKSYAESVLSDTDETANPSGTQGLGSINSPDSAAAVQPLSEQAWTKMHPEFDQSLNDDAPENGDVSTHNSFTPALAGFSGGSSGVTDQGTVPELGDVTYGSTQGGNYVTDDANVGETIVRVAKAMLGKPYVWGGEDWSGADCSGLVQLAYKQAGIDMPRLSNFQMNKGKVTDYKDLKPGDLIGWNNSNHVVGADHIAIYIGNNQIIEAPRPGVNIRVAGLFDYDTSEMWAVRIPGKHVAPQPTASPKPPKQPKNAKKPPAGYSTRAVQEGAGPKPPKPKPNKAENSGGNRASVR